VPHHSARRLGDGLRGNELRGDAMRSASAPIRRASQLVFCSKIVELCIFASLLAILTTLVQSVYVGALSVALHSSSAYMQPNLYVP